MKTWNHGRLALGLVLAGLPALAAAEMPAESGHFDCVIKPRATVELGSPDEGILAAVEVQRGARVRKGQTVAKLDARVEALSNELARIRAQTDVQVRSASAQVNYRDKQLERMRTMLGRKAVSQTEFDQAEVELRLAKLAAEAAGMEHRLAKTEYQLAQARLARRTVQNTVDGVVVEVSRSPGEYVHEQAPLMTVAEMDPLHVDVFLPVARYGVVAVGDTAQILPEAPIGGEHAATVTVVDKVFDAASRTFGVRLELPNPEYRLPAGLRCKVQFGAEPAPAGR